MEQDFIKAELRERELIKTLPSIIKGTEIYEISQVQDFSSWDFIGVMDKQYIMAEVKVRSFESAKYDKAVLESDKINRLVQLNLEDNVHTNQQLYYFSFYEDDRILYVWNIYTTPTTIGREWMPKATNNPSKGYCWKSVNYFNLEDAITKIKY